MERYAVYPDISPGYVVVDTLSETVVALYPDRRNAERAARRLNNYPVIAPPRSCALSTAASSGGGGSARP